MVEKSPDAFRTISEVASDLDVPQHVLRFWETRFSQVKPMKRGGGRRYYRPDDVELLRGIRHLLYGDGYTIKGVQRILRENGVRHVIGLGKSLHHDVTNGAATEVKEGASEPPEATPTTPIPPASDGHDAADIRLDAVKSATEAPASAEPDAPEPASTSTVHASPERQDHISEAPSPVRDPSEAEETIDFSASRSVLVRRRREEDAAAPKPAEPEIPDAPEASNGAGEPEVVQASGGEATLPAEQEPEVEQDAAASAEPGPAVIEPPAATEPAQQAVSPETAVPASRTTLNEDDVIRLQAAVFELLECRRILSEQD